MTDLPTRVREAFEGGPDQPEDDWLDRRLADVIAVVQEDRTREIVVALRIAAPSDSGLAPAAAAQAAAFIWAAFPATGGPKDPPPLSQDEGLEA